MSEIGNVGNHFTNRPENFFDSFKKTFNENKKFYNTIGNKMENAKTAYFDALASGDHAKIAKAKDKYDTMVLAMQSVIQFLSNRFRIMMNIVNNISIR